MKDRAKKFSYGQLEKVTEGETQTIDDQEGVTDFSIEVPANKKQAYYIVNGSSPENISNSEDIVLLIPVSDEKGESLTDVWLYPKSKKLELKGEIKKVISTGVKRDFFDNCRDFFTHLFFNDQDEMMKITKMLASNPPFLAATILYCGLVSSRLSTYPRYQRLFVHFPNIQHASILLGVINKLLINPIFMASLFLLAGLVTWVLGKRE